MKDHPSKEPTVELPDSGIASRRPKKVAASPALPDVDDTIKIPERMAASCGRAVFICAVLAAIALLDAQDPMFRTFVVNTTETLIYRLSLEHIVSGIAFLYQQLVNGTLFLLGTLHA